MTTTLIVALGTRRGKAERWITELPHRFPHLDIQTIKPEQIDTLPVAPDADSVAVLDEPVSDIELFLSVVRSASVRGCQVYLQYFPAEPLVVLVQADMKHRGNLMGADTLKKELTQLRTEQEYWQILEKENRLPAS